MRESEKKIEKTSLFQLSFVKCIATRNIYKIRYTCKHSSCNAVSLFVELCTKPAEKSLVVLVRK